LSPASKRSLHWQGGAMTQAEAQAFINRPYAREAMTLRRWDDRAKDPTALVPPLSHYRELLDGLPPAVEFRASGR
jgi:gamma-butyrobetaine dioxygenase